MARPQIQSLQVFRGLAALAVVAHHASISTVAFVGAVPPAAMSVFSRGYLGVDFFFVLSGFIIMYAHMEDEHSPAAMRRYVFKRLVRIFPAYLPISVALIALYAAVPGFSASAAVRDYSLASSLLLLPADRPPVLSVAWTLVHELLFYAVFLLFFVSRRWFAIGLLAWGAIIVVSTLGQGRAGWPRYPLSLLNIQFMLGVLSAWVVTSPVCRCKPQWLMVCGFAVSLFLLILIDRDIVTYLRLALASGLALMIVGFARWEQASSLSWPLWLLLMGNASYSIYLIHNPLLSVTQRLAGRMGLGWVGAMVFGVVLSVLAGYIYHLAVERRALRFFQNRLRKK